MSENWLPTAREVRDEAWNAALEAAMRAVAATEAVKPSEGAYVFRARALAAIDALLLAPHHDPCDCDDCRGRA